MDIECYQVVKRNLLLPLLILVILFIILLALLLVQPAQGKILLEAGYPNRLLDVQNDVTVVPFSVQYIKQAGMPLYSKNLFHPDKGCNWSGIAGQVFGRDSVPQQMLVVELSGVINGRTLYSLTLTGAAPAYGSGGYEIEFPQGPFNSSGAIGIKLYDLQGNELSEKVYFDTYNDCNRNLVILNFVSANAGPTPVATSTATPTRLSSTATSTPSTTPGVPTATATPSRTPSSARYQLQPGSPTYRSNLYHPELGCRWMGVAGQVFGKDGVPVKKLVVEVGGILNGRQISVLGLSGVTTAYGPGGFEMTIDNRTVNSRRTLWVMLYDLEGRVLSDQVYFDTYEDCGRNLILINFVAAP
mgnify:CR=1 FL=1